MDFLPSDDALILLGVLPNPRDLEIARLLGWYRIPLRRAPKVVDVDYVAFYQPGCFGEAERWRVAWFAEARGHELTTRGELLRDEANHPRAAEEYYKIQLGPLRARVPAVKATGWRRLTFLYTTGLLFRTASTINQLVVREEERAQLWRQLRERALAGGQYTPTELPEETIDPAVLAFLAGFLAG